MKKSKRVLLALLSVLCGATAVFAVASCSGGNDKPPVDVVDPTPTPVDPTPVDPTPVDPTPTPVETKVDPAADVVADGKTYKKTALQAVEVTNNDPSGDWWNGGTTDVQVPAGDFALVWQWKNTRDGNWHQDASYEFQSEANAYFNMESMVLVPRGGLGGTSAKTVITIDGKEVDELPAQGESANGMYGGNYTTSIIRAGDILIVEEILESDNGSVIVATTTMKNFSTSALKARIAGNPFFLDEITATVGGVDYEKPAPAEKEPPVPTFKPSALASYDLTLAGAPIAKASSFEQKVILNHDADPFWWAGGTTDSFDVSGNFAVTYKFDMYRDALYTDTVVEFTDGSGYYDLTVFEGLGWGNLNPSATAKRYCQIDGIFVNDFPALGSSNCFLGAYRIDIVRVGTDFIVDQILDSLDGHTYRATNVYSNFTTANLNAKLTGNTYWIDNILAFSGEASDFSAANLADVDAAITAAMTPRANAINAILDSCDLTEFGYNGFDNRITVTLADNAYTGTFEAIVGDGTAFGDVWNGLVVGIWTDGVYNVARPDFYVWSGGSTVWSQTNTAYFATLPFYTLPMDKQGATIKVDIVKSNGSATVTYTVTPVDAGANYVSESTVGAATAKIEIKVMDSYEIKYEIDYTSSIDFAVYGDGASLKPVGNVD